MNLNFNFDGKTLLKNWWQTVKKNFEAIQTAFEEETDARKSADTILQQNIDKEKTAREKADDKHMLEKAGVQAYSHVRVSDSVDSALGVSASTAATPYAVKQAYDKAMQGVNDAAEVQSNLDAEKTAREEADNNIIRGANTAIATSEKNITRHIQNVELLLEDETNAREEADEAIRTENNEHKAKAVLDHPDKSVTTNKLADGSVTTNKLASGSVTSVKLASGSVTSVKLADKSVTSEKIADEGVQRRNIAPGAVTADELDDESVTSDKIQDNAIFEYHLNQDLRDKITGHIRKINLSEYYHYDEDIHQLRCDKFPSTGLYVVYADAVPDNANNILFVNDEVGYQLSKDIEEGNTYLFVVKDEVVTGVDGSNGHIDVYNGTDVDAKLSETSENPVQNKAVTSEINKKLTKSELTSSSSFILNRRGWQRIAKREGTGTTGNWILSITRTFSATNNEVYTFLIDMSHEHFEIQQLGCSVNIQLITQLRVVHSNIRTNPAYLEFYYDSTASNDCQVRIFNLSRLEGSNFVCTELMQGGVPQNYSDMTVDISAKTLEERIAALEAQLT